MKMMNRTLFFIAFSIHQFSFVASEALGASEVKLFDTSSWKAPTSNASVSNANATVNGTPWISKGSGYLRVKSGNAQLSFSSLGIEFGPRIELNFKKLMSLGRYTVGACYSPDCVSAIVKIRGAGLAASEDKSTLEITQIDEKNGTISGKFDLFFDPMSPPVNQNSAFKEGLHFERGEFKKMKIDFYR